MAYTTSQLQALQDAVASGTLSVEFEGKKVTYRSLDDMQRVIAIIQADLGTPAPTRFSLTGMKRG
jgi:hypothetical protein